MFIDNSREGELYYQLDIPFSQGEVVFITNAVIQNVQRSAGNLLVTAAFDGPGPGREQIVLIVSGQTVIQDQQGRPRNRNDLRPGTMVNALVSSRMTRSMPPQTNAFIVIINSSRQQNLVMVGIVQNWNPRNNSIIVMDRGGRMRFFTNNNTIVTGRQGQRIPLAMLRPGNQVRVEYQQLPDGRRGTVNMAVRIQQR